MGKGGSGSGKGRRLQCRKILQARSVQAHPGQPGPLRLVAGDPVAPDAAPMEVERRPPGLHHSRGAVEAGHGGRDRAVQPGSRPGHPVPLPRQQDPQPLGPRPRLMRQEPWRARCPETGTPGSASGLGRRARSNPGTAPQTDSTSSARNRQCSRVTTGFAGPGQDRCSREVTAAARRMLTWAPSSRNPRARATRREAWGRARHCGSLPSAIAWATAADAAACARPRPRAAEAVSTLRCAVPQGQSR